METVCPRQPGRGNRSLPAVNERPTLDIPLRENLWPTRRDLSISGGTAAPVISTLVDLSVRTRGCKRSQAPAVTLNGLVSPRARPGSRQVRGPAPAAAEAQR